MCIYLGSGVFRGEGAGRSSYDLGIYPSAAVYVAHTLRGLYLAEIENELEDAGLPLTVSLSIPMLL